MSNADPNLPQRSAAILLTGVIGVAIVGYFVGINDGVPQQDDSLPIEQSHDVPVADAAEPASSSAPLPAPNYSEMRRMEGQCFFKAEG